MDWVMTTYFNETNMFPESCVCVEEGEFCGSTNITDQLIYNRVSL